MGSFARTSSSRIHFGVACRPSVKYHFIYRRYVWLSGSILIHRIASFMNVTLCGLHIAFSCRGEDTEGAGE